MDDKNFFDQVKNLLGSNPEKVNILQHQVDMDLQMEYFEKSQQHESTEKSTVLANAEQLHDDSISIEDKKLLLIRLAKINDVAVFRKLEEYVQTATDDMSGWAILAYQESLMTIKSEFFDEQQVFISTGLGGKGQNLRYFIVFISQNDTEFSPMQQRVISNELKYTIVEQEGEIEKISYEGKYALTVIVMPVMASVENLLSKTIKLCNQLGSFVSDNYIVTNVKEMTVDEIDVFIAKAES